MGLNFNSSKLQFYRQQTPKPTPKPTQKQSETNTENQKPTNTQEKINHQILDSFKRFSG